MNNEEIKTPEVTAEDTAVTPETPVEAPVEAPAEAPAATPVRAPIANPHKYFLLSNIFRSITVVLLITCVLMTLFLPVFTVGKGEDAVSFSVMDVISDIGDEFTLCFADEENPENWEKLAKIQANPGNFSQAITATELSLIGDNDSPLADMVNSFAGTRILIMIPYFLLLLPLSIVIGLIISAIIRLVSTIIGWINPSPQVKKNDAGSCIAAVILTAVCYIVHFFYSAFTLNFVNIAILGVVAIGCLVMDIVYKKHTKDIVDAQFGL